MTELESNSESREKAVINDNLLAFAVEARLKSGAIGQGVIFATSEDAAKIDASTDGECVEIICLRRLESHDMFRTTFKSGKVYRPQAFLG